jgi:uncharacterized protein (UPF0335 family)
MSRVRAIRARGDQSIAKGGEHMDGDTRTNVALGAFVGRISNLHDDRDAINGDIREVYAEAKEAGFNVTILREIVREKRMDAEARHARYELLDDYRQQLGMLADTPLGEAALNTVTQLRRPRTRRRKTEDVLDEARANIPDGGRQFDA